MLAVETMAPYELRYNCGPVSLAFHKDKVSRVKLLIGPFGTGKTSSAAYDQIMCQSKRVLPKSDGIRYSRFAVVRNTFPQLRDTTIKTVLDWFPPSVFGVYHASEKRYVVYVEDRCIEILFRALDIEKDVRNLLSLELTGAWIDEAREINHSVIKGLLGRMTRYPAMKDFGGREPWIYPCQLILTTNYPSREHHLYRDFVSHPIEGYTMYEQGQKENAHNLAANYYINLERDYRDRPDLLRTLVRGEWGVTVIGRLVYPEFQRRHHVADGPLLSKVIDGLRYNNTIVRGWDNTGLSPACIITHMYKLRQWMWIKEFTDEDMRISDFGDMVSLWCQQELPKDVRYVDWGDPAGKNRDSNKMSPYLYLKRDCNIVVRSGIQTFKVRRDAVAGQLVKMVKGEPALMVDPSCIRVIDGFEGGYAYPEIGNSGVYKTEPAKNQYSHIHDAGQYPATRLFVSGYDRKYVQPPIDKGIM